MTEQQALDLNGIDQPAAALPHGPAHSLTFTVYGEPIPKGSSKAFVVHGRARITNDNPRTRSWQALVSDAAHLAVADEPPIAGPVAVHLRFTMPRPKSRPKPWMQPDRKPDLDKLQRAALDALTGPVFVDDGQVIDITATKRYVGHPDALREPGLVVDVWPLP